jgi:hypothetical protein
MKHENWLRNTATCHVTAKRKLMQRCCLGRTTNQNQNQKTHIVFAEAVEVTTSIAGASMMANKPTNRTMNMEHLLAATKKVVELHNENVQLHTELADAKCKLAKYQNDSGDDSLYNVRRLRSELAEAIKQRDALAGALREVVNSWDDSTWLDENDFERFRTLINENK